MVGFERKTLLLAYPKRKSPHAERAMRLGSGEKRKRERPSVAWRSAMPNQQTMRNWAYASSPSRGAMADVPIEGSSNASQNQ